MGLSGFNRARRSRLPVELNEAERFKKDNEARWKSHHLLDTDKVAEERELKKSRHLEAAAGQEIGKKAQEGIDSAAKGGPADLPLRRDHAAEIAGRTVEDAQGEPKDDAQRLRERIPDGTANEKLVGHLDANRPGPTAAMVTAAVLESTPEADRDAAKSQMKADAKTALAQREQVDADKERRSNREAMIASADQTDAAIANGTDAAVVKHNAGGGGPVEEPTGAKSPGDEVAARRTPGEKRDAQAAINAEAGAKLPAAGTSAGAGTEPVTSSKDISEKKSSSGKTTKTS